MALLDNFTPLVCLQLGDCSFVWYEFYRYNKCFRYQVLLTWFSIENYIIDRGWKMGKIGPTRNGLLKANSSFSQNDVLFNLGASKAFFENLILVLERDWSKQVIIPSIKLNQSQSQIVTSIQSKPGSQGERYINQSSSSFLEVKQTDVYLFHSKYGAELSSWMDIW